MEAENMQMAIARSGKTRRNLAKKVGLSEHAFYNKIKGLTEFKASEIKVLAKELSLTGEEVNRIFFD